MYHHRCVHAVFVCLRMSKLPLRKEITMSKWFGILIFFIILLDSLNSCVLFYIQIHDQMVQCLSYVLFISLLVSSRLVDLKRGFLLFCVCWRIEIVNAERCKLIVRTVQPHTQTHATSIYYSYIHVNIRMADWNRRICFGNRIMYQ